MRTIVVYVVISSAEDIYFEQVWASAWSLKHYNPNAHVLVLTDDETKSTINAEGRKASLNCIDELQTVSFDGEYSKREKSRWIKTNMRKLVKGDFLFIDADSIICDDLSEVDDWNCSIGAVFDSHCHATEVANTIPFQDMYVGRLKKVFGIDYNNEDVFNSGVMFVKDDEKAHRFFETWHKNWIISNSKGFHVDQLPLLKTNIELGQVIEEIPGEFNCQIRCSVEYLTRAKILHTFTSQSNSELSVLLGPQIYEDIKREHQITQAIKDILINCKESFSSPSYLVERKWMRIRFQPAFEFVNMALDSNKFFDRLSLKTINFMARAMSFISRHIK